MPAAKLLSLPFPPRALPRAVCLALTLAGAVASLPAQAQTPTAAAAPSIPAGPLEQALSTFAERAGVTLSYSPDAVRGLSSPGLAGGGTLEEGLSRLLSGSGLVAQKTASGYVVLPGKTDDSVQLDATSIDATAVQSAFAPVAGYYASNASSATKSDLPIVETAQSISVVTAEQMADRKVNRVEDAVAYTAGVRVGGSGLDPRFDTINVRGFETTQSADFLDGLRQAGSGWLALPSLEAYSLERVEVLKGPASILYGQISPGGMVNRVSKRPSLQAENQVEIQAGNYDHRQGQFDVGGKLDEAGNVLWRTVGIYRDAHYSIEQMNNDTRLLAPSLSWQIDDATSLTLLAQYQERETAGSPMLYRDGDHLTNIWQGDEYFDKLEQRKWSFGYEFEHAFNETFSVQHSLRYGQLDTTNQYLDVGTVLADGHTLPRTTAGSYEDMTSLATDTRLVSRFATGPLEHRLLTGADYAWVDTALLYATGEAPSLDLAAPNYHQRISRPDTIQVDRDGLEHRAGIYLQDQIELDRWRLSAGLRRDWVHVRYNGLQWGSDTNTKTGDSATTGQIGALYLFDNGLAPYISYATSFLPQSGSNADGLLKPTEGKQYEVGLKYQPPGSSTLLTASLYHLTQENVSTRDPVRPLNTVQTGEQVSKGLELEAVSDLTDALRMTASYSFNDAEVTKDSDFKGKAPKNVPRHLASLWLDYRLPLGLGVSGGARYTGNNYGDGDNTVKNEGYTLVDAGVYYDFGAGLDGVRLALNARNLTDKRYINCQDGYCYRGEARSFVTSLSYNW